MDGYLNTPSVSTMPPVEGGLAMRPAEPSDEALLYTLLAEEKAVQLAAIGWGEEQWGPLIQMQFRGRKMTYLESYPEAEDFILLGKNNKPIGRLLLDRKPDRWRIVDIALLAKHRRQGLGTRVILQWQHRAASAGVRMELQVSPLSSARRLYERLGFRATREDAISVDMVWISPIEKMD